MPDSQTKADWRETCLVLAKNRDTDNTMRLFSCQSCGQILFFENTRCERCGHRLGFLPREGVLSALEPSAGRSASGETWRALAAADREVRPCANAAFDVCNWLVDAADENAFCIACRHNRVVPDLDGFGARLAWGKVEAAKHRLFYSLEKLGLLRTLDTLGGSEPLTFRFLADDPGDPGSKVMTGHDDGVITIALSEADDAERERRRKAMNEPYRTLLGHFRHEVGHYFWDRLVRDGGTLAECRAVFGDDTADYQASLQKHYENGPPQDWQQHFVSAYATCHPWEDFAETWAHYLHIVDTLELAAAYGLTLAPAVDREGEYAVPYDADPYRAPDIGALIRVWLPTSTALNTFNRAMGKDELYPFLLAPGVVTKLGFIHSLLAGKIGAPSRKGTPARPIA